MKIHLYFCSLFVVLLASCEPKPLPVVDTENPHNSRDTVWITLHFSRETRVTEKSYRGYLITRFLNEQMMNVCSTPDCTSELTSPRSKMGWHRIISPDSAQKWNPLTDNIPNDAPDSMTFHLYNKFSLIFDWGGKKANNSVLRNDTLWYFNISPIIVTDLATLPSATTGNDTLNFDGWNYNGSRYALASPITLPAVLSARWIPTHKVIFNTDGGGEPLLPVRVSEGARLPRPDIPSNTDDAMLFWGWYQDSDHEVLWNFAQSVTAPLTLYARWYDSRTKPPQIFVTGNLREVLMDDLPGLYSWTKNGEDSRLPYNPCPSGWEVPALATLRYLTDTCTTCRTLNIQSASWSSAYADSVEDRPLYKHRAYIGTGEPKPVIESAPVRCVKYAQP